jgi:S1-C subfamily serine protease
MNSELEKARFGFLLALTIVLLVACGKGSLPELEENLAGVIKKAGPSVVCIVGKNESSGETKIGSGVILRDGYILTTENILVNVDNITVKLQDGSTISDEEVKRVFCDFETNVSLLQVEAEDLKPVKIMQEEKIRNGTLGIALGNTNYSKGLQVSIGTISHSWIGGADAYDENLLIWNGSKVPYPCGTPVFNSNAQLVGITEGRPEGEDGVIFMLPAMTCVRVSEVLKKDGQVRRAWIGVFSEGRCGEAGKAELGAGVLITEIVKESPAFKSGLKPGDRIIEFNGEPVESPTQLRKSVSAFSAGSRAVLTVIRNGEKRGRKIAIETEEYDGLGMRRCPHRSI